MGVNAHLTTVPVVMLLPFVVLLAMIALAPFWFASWWSRHYTKACLALAIFVIGWYLLHGSTQGVLHTANDYFSFICLIGSLYIVSGGIHLNVKGEATPIANVLFLLSGALISNILGTTGASMLLIRPWLRMNKYRLTGHHVIFFIFIVSNVGGCLTPVGDPPLFLGYLMGVPFTWVMRHSLPMWAVGVGLLLLMFFWVDRRNYLKAPKEVREHQTAHEEWAINGLQNLPLLALILGAVFVHHPVFLREMLMISAAVASLFVTPRRVHEMNQFSLGPLREVAFLFVGIFATMMPALDWLQFNASRLELASPGFFYWGSGSLSSVLDNSPTYLCFLKASFGRFIGDDTLANLSQILQSASRHTLAVNQCPDDVLRTIEALKRYHPTEFSKGTFNSDQVQVAYLLGNFRLNAYLLAISVGSVFFGANTYIGNGPNFMVKAIADHQNVHTPGFLKYISHYTIPFMLPMLAIVWWLFFR